MKTKLVRIGNSQGVRIPKHLLEQAGLEGEVRLRIVDSGIIIEGASHPRAGWDRAAELVWCPRSSRATESVEAPDPARRDDE